MFLWAEAQPTPIGRAAEYGGCLDCATPEVVSQQLWALLGGLLKGDASAKRTFANVPRHNVFEAWRRVVEPVNEDKALIRKDLFPLVTNPKAASSMDDLTAALEAWETNKRLFEKADGKLPDHEQERLAFVGILPHDISANVIMEMEKPGFSTFDEIKKYAIKLVTVMQNQRRHRKPLNMVDAYQGQVEPEFEQQSEEDEYELETEAGLQEILSMDLAPVDRAAEINAFMQKRFNQRSRTGPPPRGRPTQPGRFQTSRSASAPARPPLVTVADALGEVSRMPVADPVAKQYEQTRQHACGETKEMKCNNAGGETKEVAIPEREDECEFKMPVAKQKQWQCRNERNELSMLLGLMKTCLHQGRPI